MPSESMKQWRKVALRGFSMLLKFLLSSVSSVWLFVFCSLQTPRFSLLALLIHCQGSGVTPRLNLQDILLIPLFSRPTFLYISILLLALLLLPLKMILSCYIKDFSLLNFFFSCQIFLYRMVLYTHSNILQQMLLCLNWSLSVQWKSLYLQLL